MCGANRIRHASSDSSGKFQEASVQWPIMKLLLVEDDVRIARALKKGLEDERWVVDHAADGETGRDFATIGQYDVIILDYLLPIYDGLQVCSELRKLKIYTPVLMLTARSQKADIIACLDAGADDYLTKPFSFEELLARIRALTRRPIQQVARVLQVGDLMLDPQSYMVTRGDVPIHLTQKEYVLLEYLMRHAGVAVKKDQIIESVWDFDADILPNTIEVYVRKLREKVDIPFAPAPPLIHTVRGFGYAIKS